MWTITGTKWIGEAEFFFNRPFYDELITGMEKKTKVLVYGTPGIGKSFFLQRLLVHIVESAKDKSTLIPGVSYVRIENNIVREYMLLPDGTTERYDLRRHGLPDYLLSDAVDLEVGNGQLLSIEVASDKDTNYNHFRKRVQEMGAFGKQIIMPLFTFEELLFIKRPAMTESEALFRFDVFGGSARNFKDDEKVVDELPFVEESMLWFFGEDIKTIFFGSWQNVFTKISQEFGKSKKETYNVINSLMIHKTAGGKNIWASKFMEVLAGIIMENREADVLEELRIIIGRSGFGNLFESIGHRKLTTRPTKYFLKPLFAPRAKRNRKTEEKCFQGHIALIRSIPDILRLPDGAYGLPLFTNFPLVDAIVQPDILLQFTTSPRVHKGSVDSLQHIRSLLHERNQDMHKMIFVVPKDNLQSFTYQSDLPNICQYITCDDFVAGAKVLQ